MKLPPVGPGSEVTEGHVVVATVPGLVAAAVRCAVSDTELELEDNLVVGAERNPSYQRTMDYSAQGGLASCRQSCRPGGRRTQWLVRMAMLRVSAGTLAEESDIHIESPLNRTHAKTARTMVDERSAAWLEAQAAV